VLLGHFGAEGLWWSFPLSSAFAALLAWLYYRFGGWRSAQFIPAPATAPTPSMEAT
jgi:Na+-driven multidrug efflux pump